MKGLTLSRKSYSTFTYNKVVDTRIQFGEPKSEDVKFIVKQETIVYFSSWLGQNMKNSLYNTVPQTRENRSCFS